MDRAAILACPIMVVRVVMYAAPPTESPEETLAASYLPPPREGDRSGRCRCGVQTLSSSDVWTGPLCPQRRTDISRTSASYHLRKSFDHPTAYAANSSSSALASFRSRVSKPSVNHPYTGATSSRACRTLLWSRHSRAMLTAARSSMTFACSARATESARRKRPRPRLCPWQNGQAEALP